MEKITNKISEDFPPTTLYLDDLAQIVEVLAQACKEIEIKTGEYKITDPSELTELASKFPAGRFDHVYLKGYDPFISIDLRTYGVSAYISEDTLVQRGIVSKVRDIVNSGKKKNPGWFYVALSNVAVLVGTWQIVSKEYVVGALLILLSLATIPLNVRSGMKNKVIVHSQQRSEVKTFFERKKDDIALAGISAILGGIVGYMITKLMP
ncbi:MAG: hypothetical protein Q7J42_17615 [Sulfuritalea sp.]|nr:hypothetical protein [Sulfuritalea sp.]